MKKAMFVFVCTMMAAAAQAQISVGAKGGLNFATIVGKDVDGYNT